MLTSREGNQIHWYLYISMFDIVKKVYIYIYKHVYINAEQIFLLWKISVQNESPAPVFKETNICIHFSSIIIALEQDSR